MTQLYWHIGRNILSRQEAEGWGAKVIDRLSVDLRTSYPEMSGISARNLKYMRAFAEAWPDPAIVQRALHKLPWGVNLELLDALKDPKARLWYAERALEQGWSRAVLAMHIGRRMYARQGKALTKLPKELEGSLPTVAQIEAELAPRKHAKR
jgi:predicted nuclease of restriction endonuclease-like (RecB) superfamily